MKNAARCLRALNTIIFMTPDGASQDEGAEWKVAVFLLVWILSQPSGHGCLKAGISWACVGSGSNKLKPSLILLSDARPFHFHASSFLVAECKCWSRWSHSWAWTRSEVAAWRGLAPAVSVQALQVYSRVWKLSAPANQPLYNRNFSLDGRVLMAAYEICVLWLQVKLFILGVESWRGQQNMYV